MTTHSPSRARFRAKSPLLLAASLFAGLTLSLHAYPLQTLTTNVQPFNGTDNDGDTFPGAVLPFGMIQWSPDTTSLDHSGGYFYPDSQIIGFSLDHLSGAGCGYGGDFAFTPILGYLTTSPDTIGNFGRTTHASTFRHADEIAVPGYYSVVFTNGIRTELTVTTRTGFGRFTYPAGSPASLLINAGSGAAGTRTASLQIDPEHREVSGWTTQNGFCGSHQTVTVYFTAVFDQPFAQYGVWNGGSLTLSATNATGAETGVYLNFDLPPGRPVLARTAISYVNVANARANLKAESGATEFTAAGFDSMAAAASNVWNGYLNKIQVTGGTTANRQTFYTMLYHALQAPSVVSDVNGQYIGFDNLIHTGTNFTKYEFFSGWDIYRSECQLLALIDPARASDMAQSLVQDACEGGAMPRWSVPAGDTGVMMGDPATPIIAGFYAFGATNFDTAGALAAMVNAATNPAVIAANGVRERDAERDYLHLGYIPAAEIGGYGPVSMTLEYCSADFALAQFAQALGDSANYTLAMNRAQNWRNHFNPASGYLEMRDADGRWSPGFPGYHGAAYVEGTAYQYFWMVPFNLRGLANTLGGTQATLDRLDTFFTEINNGDTSNSHFAYMGNEPCSETPYIYAFLGKPYRTSALVRQCMAQLFSTTPKGLPGNDDLGQMAAWYVFSALGLYPEIPGDTTLILNGPLFPEAVFHLPDGDLTISGNGAGDDAPYVQSLTVNGQPHNAPWIRYQDLAKGGTLAFAMGATANTNWGADLSVAPPSYTDGMATPTAQNFFWGTGLETGDIPLSQTNSVDAEPPGGDISNVDPIVSSAGGPELAVRTENKQSGSASIMYSGKATGGDTDFAYLLAFDLSAKPITVTPGMRLSYWVYPQSPAASSMVTGSNSAFVALDLVFSDETTLRDSDVTDQHGIAVHPAQQGNRLILDTWNYVTADLTSLAGKTINRIDFGYDQPGGNGGYRGYVDDIALSTPATGLGTNLALNQPATTDSTASGSTAGQATDGQLETTWTAADSQPNHWLQVDLGGLCNLTGNEILFPAAGSIYGYAVATSVDGTEWTPAVFKSANISTAQDQTDLFLATARYVRLTLTSLPAGHPATVAEFRVFGSKIVVPAAPATLQALGGYGFVSLEWPPSAGAASYTVKRGTSSGSEAPVATVTGTHYTDTNAAPGATYYYTVAAQNLLGSSAISSETTAEPVAPAAGSYQAALLAAHPLAYWPLNETSGSIAFDRVGGFNGTYTGGVTLGQPGLPLPASPAPEHAAVFDGTSGYVDVPSGPFNLNGALTIVLWAKLPADPAHFSCLFGRGDLSWRISINNTGQPGAADGRGEDATSQTSISDTHWHMIAYTYSGTPDTANNGTLYVDGETMANNTVNAFTVGGWDVFIGGAPDYPTDRLFAGSLAHAAVFNHALTAPEIKALYQSAKKSP